MSAASTKPRLERERDRLERILLRELASISAAVLPGADGLTNRAMLRDYGRWAKQGMVPGPQQLRRRYPELAAQLRAYFGRWT